MTRALPMIVGLCCFAAFTAAGGTRFDAKTWSGVRTYETGALGTSLESHIGEFVAVKFTFRSKDLHHLKPNWYQGAIWQPNPEGKKGFSSVRVMVAKSDLKAFKSITTESTATEEITVYGKVSRDLDLKSLFVRLIGREAAVDPSGAAVVSW